MSGGLPEREVIRVWQRRLLDGTRMVTEGGEPIEVVYPGRVNDGLGADFCDAVIGTSGGLVKGDIEVHVKSSGWHEHRHHRDAAYNRVILHVVMWHNEGMVTNLQSGEEVPVLALDKYVRSPIDRGHNFSGSATSVNVPCSGVAQRLSAGALAEFLDRAGEERFRAKTVAFQRDLVQIEAGQSLYQGIMGALGYSRNKVPFLELARRLPLHILESVTRDTVSDEEYLTRQQARLLGTAGLLPLPHPDGSRGIMSGVSRVEELESLWADVPHTAVMSSGDWQLFRVRPNNSPVRRLMAMGHLLLRYREAGLLQGLVDTVKEAPVIRGGPGLEQGLMVVDEFYRRGYALLGRERAREIIVNVLLPFVFAWSWYTSRPELAEKALTLYRQCPGRLINSIERHMWRQLGLKGRLVNSVQRQQGLIHIYHTLCTEGRCCECGLRG